MLDYCDDVGADNNVINKSYAIYVVPENQFIQGKVLSRSNIHCHNSYFIL